MKLEASSENETVESREIQMVFEIRNQLIDESLGISFFSKMIAQRYKLAPTNFNGNILFKLEARVNAGNPKTKNFSKLNFIK